MGDAISSNLVPRSGTQTPLRSLTSCGPNPKTALRPCGPNASGLGILRAKGVNCHTLKAGYLAENRGAAVEKLLEDFEAKAKVSFRGFSLSAIVLNYDDVFHNDRSRNLVIPAKAGIQDTSIPATATRVW